METSYFSHLLLDRDLAARLPLTMICFIDFPLLVETCIYCEYPIR
jgi:hypothetical protein